jgi:hypothetical protein
VIDEASLLNQPVAAKRDARTVHEEASCHDVGEGEALIQLAAAGLCPDYGASVCGGEAVRTGSSRESKYGVGLGIGIVR